MAQMRYRRACTKVTNVKTVRGNLAFFQLYHVAKINVMGNFNCKLNVRSAVAEQRDIAPVNNLQVQQSQIVDAVRRTVSDGELLSRPVTASTTQASMGNLAERVKRVSFNDDAEEIMSTSNIERYHSSV
ncbi:MAG: hypothetical protein ACJAUP_000688 [Cellvibrionaceae bacterium]|jgi:hypothetical protein